MDGQLARHSIQLHKDGRHIFRIKGLPGISVRSVFNFKHRAHQAACSAKITQQSGYKSIHNIWTFWVQIPDIYCLPSNNGIQRVTPTDRHNIYSFINQPSAFTEQFYLQRAFEDFVTPLRSQLESGQLTAHTLTILILKSTTDQLQLSPRKGSLITRRIAEQDARSVRQLFWREQL